ncbi:hypothetical protein [Cytobacillus oceanisediminis]|uniref:hypothetical protein n=1 Tax=Cytobacillus oceanisediminis TaxID=665099 RepID=UPI001C21F0F9|nr:hypothetical protein [Cytobacillus oceanisediminis]MBU8772053.1 hypothetical protein [Cytobacillus oceanisediminis]
MTLYFTSLGYNNTNNCHLNKQKYLFRKNRDSSVLEKWKTGEYGCSSDISYEDFKASLLQLAIPRKEINYLAYCSQKLDFPNSPVPSLKIKNDCQLTDAFVFSVSGNGNLSPLYALESLCALLTAEKNEHSLLITSDHPVLIDGISSRNYYPFFLSNTFNYISTKSGMFQIEDINLHLNERTDAKSNNRRTLEKILESFLKEEVIGGGKWILPNENKNFIILQQFSNTCSAFVKDFLSSSTQYQFFRREKHAHTNLLSSDLFFSLNELISKKKIKKGDCVTLIFADYNRGVGSLRLSKL